MQELEPPIVLVGIDDQLIVDRKPSWAGYPAGRHVGEPRRRASRTWPGLFDCAPKLFAGAPITRPLRQVRYGRPCVPYFSSNSTGEYVRSTASNTATWITGKFSLSFAPAVMASFDVSYRVFSFPSTDKT